MKTLVIAFLGLALLNAPTAHAFGGNRKGPLPPLKTNLSVGVVHLTSDNSLKGMYPSSVSCPKFQGTHAGNEIAFQVSASGGAGDYHHVISYKLTKAYKLEGKAEAQYEAARAGNGRIYITLPELEDSVPLIQQDMFLTTRDANGNTATHTLTFTVSRTVILDVSSDKELQKKNCFQRYTPQESTIGLIANGSTAPSTVSIKQSVSDVWGSTKGWQWGVFVSPLSFVGLGNLVALNLSYFTQTSRQTVQTVEVSTSYQLNPSDYAQIYVQPTRYVIAYDAKTVSPCGQQTRLPGAYMFQWWGFAYQIYPANPHEQDRTPIEAVGAPVINTCPKELTPVPDSDDNNVGGVQFRRTN